MCNSRMRQTRKTNRVPKPRAFSRDAYLGFRLPAEVKARLWELGRKKTRDPSSLALECVTEGLARMEREFHGQAAQ